MSTRPRFRLRYAGIAVASLVLLAIGAAALLLGTATGTRWALGQAIRFVPGELSIADYEGTLLHGLRLSRVTYSYGEIRVDAVQLTLKPDWLRSNRGRIALRQPFLAAYLHLQAQAQFVPGEAKVGEIAGLVHAGEIVDPTRLR